MHFLMYKLSKWGLLNLSRIMFQPAKGVATEISCFMSKSMFYNAMNILSGYQAIILNVIEKYI